MILDIFYLVLILFICILVGHRLNRTFNLNRSFAEEMIFSFALGIGIIGYLTLILGLLGFLYKSVFIASFIFLGMIFSFEAKLIWKGFKENSDFKIKFNWMIILIFLFLILNLIGALSPPTGWDTQIYHLTSQEIYLAQHKISYISLIHSDLPALGDMFILLGMLLKNDIVSKLIFYFIFLIFVFGIYVFSKRYLGKKVALLSVLIFLSLPLTIYRASTIYTDIILSLFVFLGVMSFADWIKKKDIKYLILSGVFIGLSLATKITAVITLISFFMFFLLRGLFAKDKIQIIKSSLIFFLLVFGVSSIWFIKSFIYTGNPVYPIAYSIFGGPQNLSYTTEYTMMQLATGGFGRGIFSYILSPWHITKNGYKFLSSFSLSPLFLTFIPLLLFFRKKKIIKYLLLFAFIYYTVWFIVHPYLVKIIPLLAILSIITSYAILEAFNRGLMPKGIWIFIIGTFVFSLLMSGLIYKNQFEVALGLESKEDYLSKNLQIFDTFNYANKNLNQSDKILMIGEARYYYLEIPFQEGDPVRQGYIDYRNINDKELESWVEEKKITHVLVNRNYFVNISDSELNLYGYTGYSGKLIEDFIKDNAEEVYEKNEVYLYEIN